ncbi:signal recognition particle receptor subunit beta [Acrasis kona]|uniref:Signal recognition particle receptor subunit beta n=1 Tax=Acrasis kona TaxID=1008807 RepID=A0AAW2YNH6_9EUKA
MSQILRTLDDSAVGKSIEPLLSQLNMRVFGLEGPVVSPSIALALVVTFVSCILLLMRKSKSKGKRDVLLLLGLPNSGKTALFYKLKDGKEFQTATSMKENDATFQPVVSKDGQKSRSLLHVVDSAGHERLRHVAFQFLPVTKAIVYMVDSVDFEDNAAPNAEYLYDLLTNSLVINNEIPILITCNKLDLALFKKLSIKKKLENEINKIRKTRSAQPETEGEEDEDHKVLDLMDNEEEVFDFGKARTDVSFVESIVTGDKIEDILNFTAQHLKISI